jgi:hypothetical protein
MSKKKLTDAEAKDILRKWPERTKSLWPTSSVGGQPFEGQANVSNMLP